MQVLCPVPVEEMALEPRELLHRAECRFQPLDGLRCSCPAEVAGGDGGEQIETHVGWRSPMRDDRLRILLEIVRRQHVV